MKTDSRDSVATVPPVPASVTPESCAAPGTAAVSSGLEQSATAALFRYTPMARSVRAPYGAFVTRRRRKCSAAASGMLAVVVQLPAGVPWVTFTLLHVPVRVALASTE